MPQDPFSQCPGDFQPRQQGQPHNAPGSPGFGGQQPYGQWGGQQPDPEPQWSGQGQWQEPQWVDQTPRQRRLGFAEAVEICLRKYATFKGRASRSELWWFFLFTFALQFMLALVVTLLSAEELYDVLGSIISLALWLPILAVGCRRLHDTGRSGWWQLLHLTGIGSLVILVFNVMASSPITNKYGPVPNLEGDVPELERLRRRHRARQQGAPGDGSFSETMSDAVGDLIDKVKDKAGNQGGQGQPGYGQQPPYTQQPPCDQQQGWEQDQQAPRQDWRQAPRQGGSWQQWQNTRRSPQDIHPGSVIPMPGSDDRNDKK